MRLKYNLDFIQDKTKKSSIKKAISILERAFYNRKEISSFFLDPFEQKIVNEIANKNDIEIIFIGGNEYSERKIFVANPYLENLSEDNYIKVMSFKINNIKHPDVLGALISLGIEREHIGDIVILNNSCEFVILEKDSNFIKYNLSKIKNEGVDINIKKENRLSIKIDESTEYKGFVSSLRIDNIISELINISRQKAKQIIKSKNVKVDFLIVEDPSKIISEGSLISIKHEGRFQFDFIDGISKKGNYHIIYRKFK